VKYDKKGTEVRMVKYKKPPKGGAR